MGRRGKSWNTTKVGKRVSKQFANPALYDYRMVKEGLTIEAVDNDGDYLGIEIRASNGRFAGYAWIYAGTDELSEFAAHIAGFPASFEDRRSYEFGSSDQNTAGGIAV